MSGINHCLCFHPVDDAVLRAALAVDVARIRAQRAVYAVADVCCLDRNRKVTNNVPCLL